MTMSSEDYEEEDDSLSTNGSDDDDYNDDNELESGDDRTMNQQMARHRSATAAAPRGATPRALAARSTSSSSTRQKQRQYTAADIDREIAADKDASDDDDDDNSSNGDSDNNDGGDYDDDDDDEQNRVKKSQQKKSKPQPTPIKASKKRTRKSGYKPVTKKPKSIPKKQTKTTSKSKRRRVESSSEDESDEEYEGEENENSNEEDDSEGGEEDSDDSEYGSSFKKTSTSRGKKGSHARSSTRSTTTRSSSTRTRRHSHRHRSNSSSSAASDSDDDITYEGNSGGGRGRGRPRRACKTQTELRMSEMVHKDMQSEKEAWGGVLEEDDRELLGLEAGGENDDDDDDDDGNSRNEENDQDGDVDSNVEEEELASSTVTRSATPKKGGKRIGIHDDDDDDYDDASSSANDEDDDDDDDEMVSDDEIISKHHKRRSNRNQRTTKNVDLSDEEIGTADEDSEDEETGPGVLMSPARKASASMIRGAYTMGSTGRNPNASIARARARMGREPLDVHDDDDEDNDAALGNTDQSTIPHSATSSSSPNKSNEVNMASHINCPSTTDEITMATLPKNKPHVCYISPDGKTRHCFALDTLYRIAISAASNRTGGGGGGIYASILLGSTQKLTFLQPPHFRSPMEDDLLDQIASRFGRAALIIEKSAIYKKMHGSIFSMNDDDELDDFDEDGEFIGYDTNYEPSRRGNFQDRFERYIQSLMGSNDVYCCPLCYNEADRRLGNVGDDEMWEDDADGDDETEEGHQHGEECFSFMDDPMRILGSLDQDQYEVASTFCFRTLMDVKTHLKVVHHVNIKDVSGNDLYHRFQIRASDGLLQSWLRRNLGKTTVQGDMMRYWNQGENQSFILLLSQIDKGRFEGETSGEYGSDFCQSFPNRARRIWREVSAPYSKDQHDMGDFIAEEGGEESKEDDDDGPAYMHINPGLTPQSHGDECGSMKSPEDQMIEFLQKKQKTNQKKESFFKRKVNGSNNDESSSNSSSSDDELEVLPKPQQYEEVDEEDEWTKSKSLKAKKGQKSIKPSCSDVDSADSSVFDSDIELVKPEAKLSGSARKRVIDDEISLGSNEDRMHNPTSPPKNGGSARKKVIESSDEESF